MYEMESLTDKRISLTDTGIDGIKISLCGLNSKRGETERGLNTHTHTSINPCKQLYLPNSPHGYHFKEHEQTK